MSRIKNELKLLRESAGVSATEVAGALQPMFPKIDKTVISKCEHQDSYGIALTKKAMRVLREKYPDAARAAAIAVRGRKADRHKKRRNITVRLSDEEYAVLQQRLKSKGQTAQEFFGSLIKTEGCYEDSDT